MTGPGNRASAARLPQEAAGREALPTGAKEAGRHRVKVEWMAALGISVLAVWLHLVFLSHAGGLWRDEVNVVNLAGRGSLVEMAKDSFPVLMPVLVGGWSEVGLGGSDAGLRWLGAMIGLGLLGALWGSAWLTRRSPPLLGLSLLALNPTLIAYGDSLRAYGVGSVLIILAAGAIWAFLDRPSLWRGFLSAGLLVLSVQALYQNSVLAGAACVGAWAVCWRRRAWGVGVMVGVFGCAAAASLVPYLPSLLRAGESAAVLRVGFQWTRAGANLRQAIGFPAAVYSFAWMLLALWIVVGGLARLWRKGPRQAEVTGSAGVDDLRLYAGVTLLAGLAGFAAFHEIAALATRPWYFLPIMALAAACFDAGLPPLGRLPRVALLGFVLGTVSVAVPGAEQALHRRFTNVDLLARRLTAETAPGDFVIVSPWYCGITFERYFKGPASWSTLPPLKDHSLHRLDLLQSQLRTPQEAIQPVQERIERALRSGNRVWVVGQMYVPLPGTLAPADLPPAPLASSGWSDGPYSRYWIGKVAHLLVERSERLELVARSSAGEINPAEDLDLFVASGWKTSQESRSPP